MSSIRNLLNQIRFIEERLTEGDGRLAERPESLPLLTAMNTARKLRDELERRFRLAADGRRLDLCRYHIHTSTGTIRAHALGRILCDYQELLSVTQEAMSSNRPKDIARITPDTREGFFDFAYTASNGGLSVVMAAPRDLVADTFDKMTEAAAMIFECAQVTTPDALHDKTRELGVAPIRKLEDWCNDHVVLGERAEIDWQRGPQLLRHLDVNLEQWQELQKTIRRASDNQTTKEDIEGDLVMLNADTESFWMHVEGEDRAIKGHYQPGTITKEKAVKLPARYAAKIEKTISVNFATGKRMAKYKLLSLNPL